MDFTVRDMLDLEVLSGLKIVAGFQGIDRKIENITFLDAPDATRWIRGNELIITTLYLYKDSSRQMNLIEYLSSRNVSALGIKLDRFVKSLSQEVINLANKLLLPLISIPNEKAWVDIINPIMAELMNRQLALLEKSNIIRRLFTKVVLEGRDLDSVAQLLSGLTNKPITIIELANKSTVTFPNEFKEFLEPRNLDYLQKGIPMEYITANDIINSTKGKVIPIEVANQVDGFIIVWQTSELQEMDLVAVEQATIATGVYIQQLKKTNVIGQRVRDIFINQLLQGVYSHCYIREKAKEIGWTVADANLVAVAQISSNNDKLVEVYDVFCRFYNDLQGYAKFDLLMGVHGSDKVVFVFPYCDNKRVSDEIVKKICCTRLELIQGVPGLKVGVGISTMCAKLDTLPQFYKEALRACRVSMVLNQECFYGELGSYLLLVELLDHPETESLINKLVEPILHYDSTYKTELYKTLDCFLFQNLNYRKTAKALYVHHNTVRYRLETIEKLLSIDLKKPGAILSLAIAMKLSNLQKGKRLGII